MSEHTPSFIMLGALGLLLTAIIILGFSGAKLSDPAMMSLVTAAAGLGGAIGGYSMPRPKQ